MMLRLFALVCAFQIAFLSVASSQDFPRELLEDDHFLEEFGVNKLTTPSIRKIFDQLSQLGELPYEEFRRDPPKSPPGDRAKLAMSLGGLIADGFFVVYTENLEDLDTIGRSILRHAAGLGAGARFTSHAKSLVEHSTQGNAEKLRDELARTQADVEIEMITLRDEDAVHLIGFGGWLRAFDVACVACLEPFTPGRAEILRRVDIADYYVQEFETLHPDILEKESMQDLMKLLVEFRDLVNIPAEEPIQEKQVRAWSAQVKKMAALAYP